MTCVIFVVALSDFDLTLHEDETKNRLAEAIELFDDISTTQFLKGSALILFLNKSDLFKRKIRTTSLKECPVMKDWEGPDPPLKTEDQFIKACNFIDAKFRDKNSFRERQIYSHVTVALDTDNVRHIFLNAKDVIIRQSLTRGKNVGGCGGLTWGFQYCEFFWGVLSLMSAFDVVFDSKNNNTHPALPHSHHT